MRRGHATSTPSARARSTRRTVRLPSRTSSPERPARPRTVVSAMPVGRHRHRQVRIGPSTDAGGDGKVGAVRRDLGVAGHHPEIGAERIQGHVSPDLHPAAARGDDAEPNRQGTAQRPGDARHIRLDARHTKPHRRRKGVVAPRQVSSSQGDRPDLDADRGCRPAPCGRGGRGRPGEGLPRGGGAPPRPEILDRKAARAVARHHRARAIDEHVPDPERGRPAHLQTARGNPFGGEPRLPRPGHPRPPDGQRAAHMRRHPGREGLVDPQVRFGHSGDVRGHGQEACPGRQVEGRQAQPHLGRRRRGLHVSVDEGVAVSGRAHRQLHASRPKDGPGQVRDDRAQARPVEASRGPDARVERRRSPHLELCEPERSFRNTESQDPHRQFGHARDHLARAGPDQGHVVEPSGALELEAGASVEADTGRGAGPATVDRDRRLGGKVEPGQPNVEALRGDARAEVDRVEAHVADFDRNGGAGGDRGGHRRAIVSPCRHVAHLDGDALRGPRPRLGQRAILEAGRSVLQKEMIDGDVERRPSHRIAARDRRC